MSEGKKGEGCSEEKVSKGESPSSFSGVSSSKSLIIFKTLISECITVVHYKLAIIVRFILSFKLLYLFLYFKKSEIMGNQCQ